MKGTNIRKLIVEGWKRVVFLGPDGEQIEFRG